MRAIGCLTVVIVIFVAGLVAGLYLAGLSPGEMVELVVEKIQEVMGETTTAAPLPAPTQGTREDVEWLAKVVMSEASIGTREEQIAVGWTVLNRLHSGRYGGSVKEVATQPKQYAYGQAPTQSIIELAAKLLRGGIGDPTGGATHFFSPRGMPKEGEPTSGYDVGGGLHEVPGIPQRVYFPSWTKTLSWIGDLANVRRAYFMFYRPVSAAAPLATVEVYNTGRVGLRIRTSPLIEDANILGKVFDGTKFLVVGGPERGNGYEWSKVRLEGWSAANWLSPPPAVGTSVIVQGTGDLGLRVREAPLINDNVIGKVYDGTRLVVLEGPATGSGYQWWKVNLEGWAARQYLRKPVAKKTEPIAVGEPITVREPITIQVAGLSNAELSALGEGITKVLEKERGRALPTVVAGRASLLSFEAEIVGGLFEGRRGVLADILAVVGLIEVQPPGDMITLPVADEVVIFGLSHLAETLGGVFGPKGEFAAKVGADTAKRLGMWLGTREMGHRGLVIIEQPGNGVMHISYDKKAKEAWVTVDLHCPKGEPNQIHMYVPFNPEAPHVKKIGDEYDYVVIFKGET